MKFIVDSMLGKLAKRLRLLGQDTLYDAALDDHEIMKIARAEGRIIVTRDKGLSKIRGARSALLISTSLQEQMKELSKLTGVHFASGTCFSRCPECNTNVEYVEKEKVKKIVPKLVFETMDKFSYCPTCKRAYWQGTHFDKLLKELKGV